MKEVAKKLNISAICKLLGVIVLVTTILIFVYLTNGTQNVYLHLIYIPIILAAYFWGVRGSLIVALVSGILAGPFMPLIVSQGIMQSTENWTTRIIILSIVGSITGILFKKVDKLNEEIRKKDLINPFTGLYNTNKLIEDLQEKIHNKEKFTIISIKLTNIEGIGKYVNHSIVENLTKNLINELMHGCRRDALYASSDNEIISIACAECDHIEKTKKTIKKYSNAINIEGYSVRLAIKAGIYNYSGEIENPLEVFIKARIAYEQGDKHESGIYYYNDDLEEKRKEMYEIAGTLNDALKNKELYLLYQPKINIFENTVSGVEILIRWNRGSRKPVGPNVFIKIAEEIGLIKEISKYVIEHASEQIVDWERRGIKMYT
ncbi:putative signal transduction protein (plasmid) [Peptoclostridium acidaminophilum DSM 3953]|uniref:Putative signal transduction protein n=1 Tax=Peptoclostridium acidaminophilum DSM 3953 TaxID=1286171 RepID=W8T9Y6_PEPAC|nr:EAL domain-containing protein [Peptoclostridium acidaminophilum]AHM57700.1 putative signal transduction protein [Peptoclostridium acidaminophilum DSM 3953]